MSTAHSLSAGSDPAPPRKVPTIALIMTGVLLSGMDTTIVILALPTLEQSLDAALHSLVWLVIGFLLVNALLTTQAGRLGDMFGPARIYKSGFVLFTLASLLCGLAWDLPSLEVFRLLQGVGTACITANSGAIIASTFSHDERGRAYGNTGVAFSLGAVLGIVLGGLLITYVSWRWIFLINVPLGATVMLYSRTALRDRGRRFSRNLDLAGMVTLGAGLFCIIWAVTELATEALRPLIATSFFCGAVLLGVFAWNERLQAEPMLRFSLFRIPALSAPLLAALFQGLANYAVLWLAIMYLQGPKGLPPLDTALLLMPGYVLAGLICLGSGRLADRFGPLLPVAVGLGAEIIALLTFAQISPSSGLWLVVAANTANGIGLGFFIPANSSAVMKAAPQEFIGISSGMLRAFAGIGWVFSFPLVMMLSSRSISHDHAVAIFVGSAKLDGHLASVFTSGLSYAFYALSGIMVLAMAASLIRLVNTHQSRHPAVVPVRGEGAVALPDDR